MIKDGTPRVCCQTKFGELHQPGCEFCLGADLSYAVVSTPKPHRCGKNDLQRIQTDTIGSRLMQCQNCKDVWRLEYKNNSVLLGVYRNGIRQEG